MGVAPLALPAFLQNENTARLILKATKQMNIDDPAIFIQWDNNGFNDTPIADCCNGVPGQTQATLIAHIVGSGGVDFNGLHTFFLFRNTLAITQCHFPFFAKGPTIKQASQTVVFLFVE
ncbi:hypothetical protein RclHR1_23610002 [Rhizophagus clarus]|uniref:Uncharacterized protein n=1 Tax=Rhizophagus clarus TaxID=94130 RepID=A0A2Z6RR00_9GLOM|nr:hypothetical protein RclHR1_23610002 [Rhizophagus clarus]